MGIAYPHYEEIEHVRPIATIGLVVANVVIYLLTSINNGFLAVEDVWVQAFAFVPAFIMKPEAFYRIFTSMFLHANLAHIFFNMLYLYTFGKQVEVATGARRFLALYFLSGILATIFHTAFIPVEGASSAFIPALGASGAISGVLGAYLLLFPGTRLTMCFFYFFIPFCFTTRAAAYILFWFATQIVQGYLGASLGVAVFAHAGGFIGGIALLPIVLDYERLGMLRVYASMKRFFFNVFFVKPGLGTLSKAILVLLIGLTAAGALYSALVGATTGGVNKILDISAASCTTPSGCQAGYVNESVIVQLNNGKLDYTPISTSEVRVVFNRLNAANLVYNNQYMGRTVDVRLATTGRVQGIPVKVVINATLSYDKFGLINSGSGTVETEVLQCDPITGRCAKGGIMTYSFFVSTAASMVGFQGIPITQLAALAFLVSLGSIIVIGRSEKFEIIA
ncbi:rhomboid family intramembrane serine protease, partial [Infirmifilum sp.]|uniref:rhomboid family intramembrane serine protease n=1 Tax=Infirmifilum sp. TaxID=2856575 RepID=UPI003D15076D